MSFEESINEKKKFLLILKNVSLPTSTKQARAAEAQHGMDIINTHLKRIFSSRGYLRLRQSFKKLWIQLIEIP